MKIDRIISTLGSIETNDDIDSIDVLWCREAARILRDAHAAGYVSDEGRVRKVRYHSPVSGNRRVRCVFEGHNDMGWEVRASKGETVMILAAPAAAAQEAKP